MLNTLSRRWRIITLIATFFTTPAVLAHAHLQGHYPPADVHVSAAPQALTLNFSEGIEAKFSGLTITDAQQQTIKTGAVKRNESDNKQMIVPLEQPLRPGNYTVKWHVVSVDGHKTHGAYHFTVK